RKTRGAVYRIEFVGQRNAALNASNWLAQVDTQAQAVLLAPQPLDAWSRAYWEPTVTQLGTTPFIAVAGDARSPISARLRAIEILTQLSAGLTPTLAFDLAHDNLPEIRARTAWSLGRVPTQNYEQTLIGLSRDNEPLVRRAALDAILDRLESANASTLQ